MEEIKKIGEDPDHSWFSPSSTAENILCPGRINACRGLENKTNKEASGGSLCHKYVEKHYRGLSADAEAIRLSFDPDSWHEAAVKRGIKQMDSYLGELLIKYGKPEVQLEEKVFLMEDMTVFGTVDIRLWFPESRLLAIGDWKFGQEEIFADAPQCLTYASCYLGIYNPETVITFIIQPRVKDSVEEKVWTGNQIIDWKRDILLPAIEKCKDPNAPRSPGKKQCAYCAYAKQKGCSEYANSLLTEVQPLSEVTTSEMATTVRIPDYAALPADRLAKLVGMFDFIRKSMENAEEALVTRMLKGEQFEGLKLVNKYTKSKWKDEGKAEGFLARKKIPVEDRRVTKTVSPAQAKKLLAKLDMPKASWTAFEDLIEKPVGDPTYAPISDKREPYTPPCEPPVDPKPLPEPQQVDISSLF